MSETIRSSATDIYPGYPQKRLHIPAFEAFDGVAIPTGPWTINDDLPPDISEQCQFRDAGLTLDSIGRPLHPWINTLLADSHGLPTGRGYYWSWGPNYTADPIVLTQEPRPRVLLIERADTRKWALPGGFVDTNEDPQDAALRELTEETGLSLSTPGTLIYQGPVADLRTTAHAWAETSAYLYEVDASSDVNGYDDALNAQWWPIDKLDELDLYGSHRALIEQAIQQKDTPQHSIAEILSNLKPGHDLTTVNGGHMAYDHVIVKHNDDQLFLKVHNPNHFTDPIREAHAKAYLAKEDSLYQHLRDREFAAIPERVELIDEIILGMDALHDSHGWHWRAPVDEKSVTYISDVLETLDQLQSITPPHKPEYHAAIQPTHETLWQEGWDTINDDILSAITDRIRFFASAWSEDRQRLSEALVTNLVTLREEAQNQPAAPKLFFAHNDARQSNITWHAEHGVKMVDWSWGDIAPRDADATMFLIDLAKSGHDIHPYTNRFNRDHARTLIGFWLAHSLWETRDDDATVREHQVASAVTAYAILVDSQTFDRTRPVSQ